MKETEEELMTVKEMIEELETYNPDARVKIIVDGLPLGFKFAFGEDEGVTPKSCKVVSLFPAYEWEKCEWDAEREWD